MSVDEICREVITTPSWQRLVIDGMGHSAPLGHEQIRTDVDRFLYAVAF